MIEDHHYTGTGSGSGSGAQWEQCRQYECYCQSDSLAVASLLWPVNSLADVCKSTAHVYGPPSNTFRYTFVENTKGGVTLHFNKQHFMSKESLLPEKLLCAFYSRACGIYKSSRQVKSDATYIPYTSDCSV